MFLYEVLIGTARRICNGRAEDTLSPSGTHGLDCLLTYFVRKTIWVIRSGSQPWIGTVEDQCRHALWIRRSEEQRHGAPLRATEYRRSLRANLVHDGTHVVHSFFEAGDPRPVREPRAAFVEHDQARERRQTSEVSRLIVVLPLQLEIRDERRDVDQVNRTIAHHLKCDADIATARVSRSGWLHQSIISSVGTAATAASYFRVSSRSSSWAAQRIGFYPSCVAHGG
jgi:hypothetical protein